jgi:hypothetical protein
VHAFLVIAAFLLLASCFLLPVANCCFLLLASCFLLLVALAALLLLGAPCFLLLASCLRVLSSCALGLALALALRAKGVLGFKQKHSKQQTSKKKDGRDRKARPVRPARGKSRRAEGERAIRKTKVVCSERAHGTAIQTADQINT